MNFNDYNILGNIINTTWGESSKNKINKSTLSIVCKMAGENQMEITHTEMFNFGEPHERKRNLDRIKQSSIAALNDTLAFVKKRFKEDADRILKTKVLSDNDSFEVLSLGQYSGRRTALYKRKVFFSIE